MGAAWDIAHKLCTVTPGIPPMSLLCHVLLQRWQTLFFIGFEHAVLLISWLCLKARIESSQLLFIPASHLPQDCRSVTWRHVHLWQVWYGLTMVERSSSCTILMQIQIAHAFHFMQMYKVSASFQAILPIYWSFTGLLNVVVNSFLPGQPLDISTLLIVSFSLNSSAAFNS